MSNAQKDPREGTTPGPWKVSVESGEVVTMAGLSVADVFNEGPDMYLIAAAPEMYEVVRDYAEAVRRYDDGEIEGDLLIRLIRDGAEIARAALAKARGTA